MAKEKETKINISGRQLRAICKEYEYDADAHLMLEEGEDERPHLIKLALSKLNRADFIIWCLYMEYGSERKVANLLNVSHTPIHTCLERIKNDLKCLLQNYL